MVTALWMLAGVLLVAVFFIIVPVVTAAWIRYRGRMVVTCPETHKAVVVDVDAKRAALTSAIGAPKLRLTDCARWPERGTCGQECLAQIETSPESCLVKNIVTKWYEGKNCALCGRAFGSISWSEHRPALMNADFVTVAWDDLDADRLREQLDTHLPVCWDCHVAETFRRRYPDLVTDRHKAERPGRFDDGSNRPNAVH